MSAIQDRADNAMRVLLDGQAHVRNTGLYRIVMSGVGWDRLQRVIDLLPVTLQGSNVVNGKGYVQFRAANDAVALLVAKIATEGDEHDLVVGLGSHLRNVVAPGDGGAYDGGNDPEPQEPTRMLAREKWQIATIAVLEKVFAERVAQFAKHGDAMTHLPDGVGPDATWLEPYTYSGAEAIQETLRSDYETRRAEPDDPMDLPLSGGFGQLTRMHLVREEIAEAFECDPDSPEFIAEITQVAALCVQWLEIKFAGEA